MTATRGPTAGDGGDPRAGIGRHGRATVQVSTTWRTLGVTSPIDGRRPTTRDVLKPI